MKCSQDSQSNDSDENPGLVTDVESEDDEDDEDYESDDEEPQEFYGLQRCEDTRLSNTISELYGEVVPLQRERRMKPYGWEAQGLSRREWRDAVEAGVTLECEGVQYPASPAMAVGRLCAFEHKRHRTVCAINDDWVYTVGLRTLYTTG